MHGWRFYKFVPLAFSNQVDYVNCELAGSNQSLCICICLHTVCTFCERLKSFGCTLNIKTALCQKKQLLRQDRKIQCLHLIAILELWHLVCLTSCLKYPSLLFDGLFISFYTLCHLTEFFLEWDSQTDGILGSPLEWLSGTDANSLSKWKYFFPSRYLCAKLS